jgi:hypothetical protein
MDPTSPDRALTTKTRRPETRIETSPLPPPPQKETMEKQKTLKRIRQLQQQKKDFIKKRMQPENEKAAGAEKFAARDATRMKKDANDAWERTDQAQILRKLEEQERKRPKTSAKAEAKISTAPLPPRSY